MEPLRDTHVHSELRSAPHAKCTFHSFHVFFSLLLSARKRIESAVFLPSLADAWLGLAAAPLWSIHGSRNEYRLLLFVVDRPYGDDNTVGTNNFTFSVIVFNGKRRQAKFHDKTR